MKMSIKSNHWSLFGFISCIELLAATVISGILAQGAGTAIFLGLAKRWIIILSLPLLGAILMLLLGNHALKTRQKIERFADSRGLFFKVMFSIFTTALIIWAFVSFLAPAQWFEGYRDYVTWLTPVSIAGGLIALQFWILWWKRAGRPQLFGALKRQFTSIPFVVVMTIGIITLLTTALTKFGIISKEEFWKGPGVPLSGLQGVYVFSVLVILVLCRNLLPWIKKVEDSLLFRIAVPIIIYGIAVWVWGTTPFYGDALAYEPTYPDFQPYPRIDAWLYDVGALSILQGKGILFHDYNDKPLFMVLLAILHLFTGNDYNAMQWAHIAVAALVPVFAYFFGRRFHNPLFGMLTAAFGILTMRNAVELSRFIASANVKILATESVTMLGVMLLVWIFFRWTQTKEWKYALLMGGVIGASALIRLNPIFFFPVVGVMVYLWCRKNRRRWVTSLILFAAGFLLLFTPWLVSGTNSEGVPWVIYKIESVIRTRIQTSTDLDYKEYASDSLAAGVAKNTGKEWIDLQVNLNEKAAETAGNSSGIKIAAFSAISNGKSDETKATSGFVSNFGEHFVHNIVTSLLALPDSNLVKGTESIRTRAYWVEDNSWDGSLPFDQMKFVVINIVLVALGITYGWKRHQWGGLIPLILFIVYDISLSAAMTSGGRYIVPIYWIMYFYYGLGLIALIEAVFLDLKKETWAEETPAENRDDTPLQIKSLLPTLMGLVIVAALVPTANLAGPLWAGEVRSQPPADTLTGLGVDPDEGLTYIQGTAHYPVYDSKTLKMTFDILHENQIDHYTISARDFLIKSEWMESGEEVIAGLDASGEVVELYLLREDDILRYSN